MMIFSHCVDEHIGVDHVDTVHDKSNIDHFSTAYDLPFNDESLDSVICTQVLEHLEEPQKALSESCRVLHPGGVAIYSVPFLWQVHEHPRDFYRYTPFCLEYIFKKAGFKNIEIKVIGGASMTMACFLSYRIASCNRSLLRYIPITPAFSVCVQMLGLLFDKINKSPDYAQHYIVLAQK